VPVIIIGCFIPPVVKSKTCAAIISTDETSSYCFILMLVPGLLWLFELILYFKNWPAYPGYRQACLLWLFELILYFKNWPAYPGYRQASLLLYWFHWAVVFGLLIGLPFHAKTWSPAWMSLISITTFTPLIWLLASEILMLRNKTSESRTLEYEGPFTQVLTGETE